MNPARWFTTSILVAPYTGVSAWGEPSYGPAVRRVARVEWTNEVTQDERAVTTATVLTVERLNPKDRVWLPSLSLVAPADGDASDATKARLVESCTAAPRVGGGVAFYETKF